MSHNAAVYETTADLAALQELLDRSAASAGSHLRSIITPERRLRAAEVCAQLTGMRLLALATVTADGRPLVGPVDGIFYRGAFHFGSSPDSVRFRHIRHRPDVSATHLPGEHLAVTVHGRATVIDVKSRSTRVSGRRCSRCTCRVTGRVGGISRLWPAVCPHRREPHVHLSRGRRCVTGNAAAGAGVRSERYVLEGAGLAGQGLLDGQAFHAAGPVETVATAGALQHVRGVLRG